jgi:hypothetical protein
MPRPRSKAELLQLAGATYDLVQAETGRLSPDAMTAPGIVGEWSVKDVLAHLLAWQQMVLGWYRAGVRGERPATPSERYTWQQIPALNQEIYEAWHNHPLEAVREQFAASHEETLALIASLTDVELFAPKQYAWTKTTTLGAYFVSCTSSHYDWARKEIRKGLKARAQT